MFRIRCHNADPLNISIKIIQLSLDIIELYQDTQIDLYIRIFVRYFVGTMNSPSGFFPDYN